MRRPTLPLFLLLAACSSLSTEEQQQLAGFQERAARYYEMNDRHLGQAMDMIERGLAIAPDDYKLNALRAAVLLRKSGSATGTDHKKLDEATELLAKVYDQRSAWRHEPIVLLNYGLALQKQGRRHLGEALRLEGQASRTPARVAEGDRTAEQLQQDAAAQRELAKQKLDAAAEHFDVLIERGELLRIAHNHRMQVARDQQDDQRFVIAANAYFEQNKLAQTVTQKRIDDTLVVPYEMEQSQWLQELRQEELGVRGLVADFFYQRKQYDKALEQLNHILEADPRRFADYWNRGRVLCELGRTDEAKADFRKFLADPSQPPTSDKVTFAVKVVSQ